MTRSDFVVAGVIALLGANLLLTALQYKQTSDFQSQWLAEREHEDAARREISRRADELNGRHAPGKNIIGSFERGSQ